MRFCLLLVVFGGICGVGEAMHVELSAKSAILMNADTGAILFEKHAHLPAFPASTTKIGTALFVLDGKKTSLDQSVYVSEAALRMKSGDETGEPAHLLETGGSTMWLRKGEVLSLEDAMHGLIMLSGNDAANAIAESLSGSIPNFMDEMNVYLNDLGCQKTRYLNPHGLHHPEHMTTAYDLALMMKKGLTIPKFRELISKVSFFRSKSNKSPKSELVAFNQLLKPGNKHYYDKIIGGKTGYHSQSMATLAVAAHFEGRTLIAVVLGCSKSSRYTDVKALFEAAFREKPVERTLIDIGRVFSKEVDGADEALIATPHNSLKISYFPSEEPECRAFVHWYPLNLPIQKNQEVGEVKVLDSKGCELVKEPLVAKRELQGNWSFRLKQWFSEWF